MFRRTFALLPDMRATPRRTAASENRCFIEFSCTATVAGRLLEFAACDLFVIHDGLISERNSYFDPIPLIASILPRPKGWLLAIQSVSAGYRDARERTGEPPASGVDLRGSRGRRRASLDRRDG